MTARLTPGEWLPLAGLLGLAAILGLMAGVDPKLAIAMAVAGAFVSIAFSNFTLALAIFCYEPAGLGVDESILARFAVLVLVLAWLGKIMSGNRRNDDFFSAYPGVTRLLALFLGWAALSIAWAEDPGVALQATGHLAAAIAIFVMAYTAIRSREQAVLASSVLVIGAVGAALLGLVAPGPTAERLSSASTGSNELAAVLVVAVAIAIGLALPKWRSPALRVAAVGAATLCLLELFFTVSRGGLISLAAMVVAAIAFGGPWRTKAAITALVVLVATFFYFNALAPQADRERIEQSTQGETRFMEGRTTIWTMAERMADDNPVVGVGVGNFKVAARHYLLEPGAVADSQEIIEQPKVAHNSYLEILTGLGVIGLAMFVAIIGFALVSALRAARNFRRYDDIVGLAIATAVAVAIVAVLTADMFLSQQAEKQVWMLLGFGPALLAVSRQGLAGEQSD